MVRGILRQTDRGSAQHRGDVVRDNFTRAVPHEPVKLDQTLDPDLDAVQRVRDLILGRNINVEPK